ncbi:MAG: HAD-IA family hydrolase [Bauldia sp.]|nr:HAD-IA family hydrolase [Bauldia sp.]
MTLPALLFDIDGTFSETEETHREAFNETFRAYGLPWSWDRPMYKKLLEVTGGKERIRHYIDGWNPEGGAGAIPLIPEMHADKTKRYTTLVDAGAAKPRPGILRIIREAKAAGMPVAIATTTSYPNVESLIVATMGADGMKVFDAVAAGDVVKKKKPAPDIYLLALEQLGTAPENAIAFEDSLNGLRSATAAGIRSIMTPSVYTDDQDFAGAFAVMSDLGEPGRPYSHLSGKGAGEAMVTADAVRRWASG